MSSVFRGFWVIGYREILRLSGQRARLVASLLTPLLFLALFGAGFNRLVGELAPGVDLVTFMFPGIVAMTVIMPSLFAGMSVVWDREFGFLREVLVAPLNRTGVALGKIGGGAAVATVEGLLVLVLAPFVGVSVGARELVLLLPLLLLLSMSLSAFGILVGLRLRSQETFQTVMALLVFPILFLSGIFFPVEATPTWMTVAAKLNPVTYGVDAIRQVLLGGTPGPGEGAGGLAADLGLQGTEGGVGLGVSIFDHPLGVGQEALILVVVGAVLVAAASRAFSSVE